MSLLYGLLYRVGFTPWDTGQVPRKLSAVIEGPEALPAGRALDIGCGTGTQAVYIEPETNGDAAGPLRNVPHSWYRLIRG